MDEKLQASLIELFTALADDELVLGHRVSEWTGFAPILEEDIALANIALDELGHARMWYELRAQLDGSDPDQLVFFRSATDYRNVQFVELPKGDWAFTMLRQYFFDAYEYVMLDALRKSRYQPLAERAEKAFKEEMYHLRHSHMWVERLALGTGESKARMVTALASLWPLVGQLFKPLPAEALLVEADFAVARSELQVRWLEIVMAHLQKVGLKAAAPLALSNLTRKQHSAHLEDLLGEMQQVARWEPQGEW